MRVTVISVASWATIATATTAAAYWQHQQFEATEATSLTEAVSEETTITAASNIAGYNSNMSGLNSSSNNKSNKNNNRHVSSGLPVHRSWAHFLCLPKGLARTQIRFTSTCAQITLTHTHMHMCAKKRRGSLSAAIVLYLARTRAPVSSQAERATLSWAGVVVVVVAAPPAALTTRRRRRWQRRKETEPNEQGRRWKSSVRSVGSLDIQQSGLQVNRAKSNTSNNNNNRNDDDNNNSSQRQKQRRRRQAAAAERRQNLGFGIFFLLFFGFSSVRFLCTVATLPYLCASLLFSLRFLVSSSPPKHVGSVFDLLQLKKETNISKTSRNYAQEVQQKQMYWKRGIHSSSSKKNTIKKKVRKSFFCKRA